MRRTLMLAALVPLAAGCATPSSPPVTAEQVTVHESVASAPPNFRVIKRLWVDSWGSAIGTPSYDSQKEAADVFRAHAANLGGNGVINFGCYRKSGDDTPLGCNGTVVRFQ
jgi:hypothetical protein